MTDYANQTFTDQVVDFDGNSFDNCTFDGCVIRFAGGNFEIRNDILLRDENRIAFEGAALATLKLLQTLGMVSDRTIKGPKSDG